MHTRIGFKPVWLLIFGLAILGFSLLLSVVTQKTETPTPIAIAESATPVKQPEVEVRFPYNYREAGVEISEDNKLCKQTGPIYKYIRMTFTDGVYVDIEIVNDPGYVEVRKYSGNEEPVKTDLPFYNWVKTAGGTAVKNCYGYLKISTGN